MGSRLLPPLEGALLEITPLRREYRVSFRVVLLLVLAAGIVGWFVGRMGAVGERPEIVLTVYRHDLGRTVEMGLEEYVRGVTAAEMPATFHPEALKAQAVAARTLALDLWQEQSPFLIILPPSSAPIPPLIRRGSPRSSSATKWGGIAYYWHSARVNRAVARRGAW